MTVHEQWQSPEFPNVAPAPQIHFRLTPLPTPKIAQALNRATSEPQVSFAVASLRLRKTSGVPDSVSFRRKHNSHKSNICLKPFLVAKWRQAIVNNPQNSMACCFPKWHVRWCWTSHFITHIHNRTKQDGAGTIDLKIRTNATIKPRDCHTIMNALRSNTTMMTWFIVTVIITVTIKNWNKYLVDFGCCS